jgi:hypothetical protein
VKRREFIGFLLGSIGALLAGSDRRGLTVPTR